MNQNHFEHNSNYFSFDQPPQYSIDHQEDLNQQRISDEKSQTELLNTVQSFCKMVIQQKQAANIDQSSPQEMSIQEIEDLKHHYLDEILSLSNQIQIKDYRNEKIDIRYRRECEIMIHELTRKFNGMSIKINKKKELQQLEQAANLSAYTTEPSRLFNFIYDDDDDYEERTIPLNDIISQLPPSIVITTSPHVLPTMEPEDSLSMRDEHLSTIPEKESDKVIKSSVEDLFPIPSESEDTFESDSDYDLPSCDDFFPIPEGKSRGCYTTSPPVLPTMEPEDSLSMRDEHLSTIPEKESDKVIKSNVEDLVPIPSEFEDTSESDSDCDLPSCDDFFPVLDGKSVTISNPLFNSNDDFTSSDDESLSDEDVPEDNVKLYSNPLFEYNDEYISSDVNPLFNEELENIDNKDSFVSNLDESVTPFSDANEDECFNPRDNIDEINAFLDMDISTEIEDDYHDSEGDIIYLESLLKNNTIHNLPPEVFFDHEPKCLTDEPELDNLTSMVKVFDPGIPEKFFSPTYVRISFEDRHYLSLTYVIRIFLPYFTYPVDSLFLLSSRSEDTIFDPDIFAFHFSSLELVDCLDFEGSHARGFVHHSLDLQSLAYRNPIC
ncbi:hypothetical protein Tco_0873803 [Tanacetum coccineum]|uniref:Uncharacterized protein n=1 Tax=Tanacetum coccineum TaxID=301880 RepID=A0ABQ5BMP9_9ASTR